MANKKPQLSTTSARALASLVERAQDWGWQSDQGVGAAFKKAERRMRLRLLRLERACQFAQGVAELYRRKLEEKDNGQG